MLIFTNSWMKEYSPTFLIGSGALTDFTRFTLVSQRPPIVPSPDSRDYLGFVKTLGGVPGSEYSIRKCYGNNLSRASM